MHTDLINELFTQLQQSLLRKDCFLLPFSSSSSLQDNVVRLNKKLSVTILLFNRPNIDENSRQSKHSTLQHNPEKSKLLKKIFELPLVISVHSRAGIFSTREKLDSRTSWSFCVITVHQLPVIYVCCKSTPCYKRAPAGDLMCGR